MGLKMPTPIKAKSNRKYMFRVRVPADIREKVSGTTIRLNVAGVPVHVKAGEHVKFSLRTHDPYEAKRRHASVLAQLNEHWDAVRNGPKSLSHRDTLAIAGEVYRTFVECLDDDPGSPELWTRVMAKDVEATTPKTHPFQALGVDAMLPKRVDIAALEARFGGLVDVVLAKHRIVTDQASRVKLLMEVGKALLEAARINKQKAEGDYSESGDTNRYPELKRNAAKPGRLLADGCSVTFDQIIDEEVKRRASGRGGKQMDTRSVSKFRRVAADFA